MQINVNVNNKTINCKQIKKNTVFFYVRFQFKQIPTCPGPMQGVSGTSGPIF